MASGPLHVRWQAYKPSWYRKEAPVHVRAILTRREIGPHGRPVMREIAHVAAYDESRATDPATIHAFWTRARFNLGKMRLRGNEITLIERALAQRIPPLPEMTNG